MRKMLIALGSVLVLSGTAAAQGTGHYPERPVRIVVPNAAGGPTDISARTIGKHLSEKFGQPFVVENRGGASGMIATRAVVKAPADGYTLLMATIAQLGIAPHLYKDAGYTIDDFEYISRVMTTTIILVTHASLPVKTVQELMSYVRANPEKISFAASGVAQTPYIPTVFLRQIIGVDYPIVPYQGAAPAGASLIGGQTQAMFDTTGTLAAIREGKVRALAVASSKRSRLMPDLPTMQEAGVPGFDFAPWYVLVAPKGTPRDILERLSVGVQEAIATSAVHDTFAAMNAEEVSSTPEEARAFVKREHDYWGDVIRKTGVKAE